MSEGRPSASPWINRYAFVDAVARDWRSAPLDPPDRGLCEFAAKLTSRQHEMVPGDLDRLREQGFDDRGIHDAVQVIGYFNRDADAFAIGSWLFASLASER